MNDDRLDRNGSARAVALAYGASVLGSVALMVVYAVGGQPQVEGVLLFVALGGLAVGLIVTAHDLLPSGGDVEERSTSLGQPAERRGARDDLLAGADPARRRFLGRLLLTAAGALGLAALFPIRSFGERPGASLFVTSWRRGARLVTNDGPIRVDAFEFGAVATVFPEGDEGAGDSPALLLRLRPEAFRPQSGRETWSPEGFVAFSKICTHAGCPVGLYQPVTHELICPCHQSTFDATQGAKPIEGPATRALPQLPLVIDEDGYIVAQGDFQEPVGPAFWRMGK